MNLEEKFKAHWVAQFPQLQPSNCSLLLAVSGGLDSVVLTHLVAAAGFDFAMVHCNFQLRGTESTRDETFVRALGTALGKKVFVKNFDTNNYALANKLSIQVAARELRYEWFPIISEEWNISLKAEGASAAAKKVWIATAHHADDNIETVLMKFFRGTGIKGMRGILPLQKDRQLIRPLLPFKKEDLLSYAKEKAIDFVEDSSNASNKYTRNYFRHELIPALKETFPSVEENIINNIHRFTEAEALYLQAIEIHKQNLLVAKGKEMHIPILKLMKSTPLHTIVWEIIKSYHFTAGQVDEVIKLTTAENANYIQSPTHRIIKNRKWLIIATLQTELANCVVVAQEQNLVIFENGKLSIDSFLPSTITIDSSPLNALFDANKIKFPLLLRKPKQGDYFYPLGMQKKKKLNRFFIDQKLSATDKERVWVLESDQKIVWVIGYRIDERVKITPASKRVVKISWTANQ